MKKLLLPTCIIAIIFLSACQGNGYQYNPTNSTTKSFTYPVASDANKNIFTNINKTTGTRTPQMFPSIPVQSGTGNSIAINPAHGQPGHRCDVAVGAPLNSPVNQVQSTASATQTSPVLSNTVVANASVKDGLNPVHGQPGHRCDIAVGAPLNSPVKQVQPTSATQTTPVLSNTIVANAGGKNGLNPVHGQPGHRCDIAVGAPLNSPVKQVQPTASATETLPLTSPLKEVEQAASASPTLPLTSPVKDVQQAAPATQLFPTLSKPLSNASGTAKLNPAHGQPGHDCTIAVGQPLKS